MIACILSIDNEIKNGLVIIILSLKFRKSGTGNWFGIICGLC
jgi:hypothetical protein